MSCAVVARWVAPDETKLTAQSSGTSTGSVEGMAGNPGGMEPAEHDLLSDLRRARRSLRLQAMTSPRRRRARRWGKG